MADTMRRRTVFTGAGAVLTGGAVTPGAGGLRSASGMDGFDPDVDGDIRPPQLGEDLFTVEGIETDRTRIRIDLRENGDAGWEIEFWTRLDDEETEAAFESVEEDVEEDPAPFLDRFTERMETTVDAAREATGREMAVEDVSVRTEREAIPEAFGLLVYTFRWTGFASVENSDILAGDAIDGFLLEDGTRLTVQWPERYDLATVDPEPDDRSDPNRLIVWFGADTEFLPGQPRIRVSTGATGLPTWFAAGTVVALIALIGAAFYLFGRDTGAGTTRARGPDEKPFEADDRPDSDGASAGGSAEATGDIADESASAATDDTADGETDTASGAADDPSEELLSNEERVLRLLDRNGGRMKQQGIVEELDWTEAKTSKVVTGLREEDRVEVYRIGRENVVALPGEADI